MVIKLTPEGKRKIAKTFGCTTRSVENALNYKMTDKEKAERMRRMAMHIGGVVWKRVKWEEVER